MALEQTRAVRAALLRRTQGAAEPGDEDMLMVRPACKTLFSRCSVLTWQRRRFGRRGRR
jgi:hypothetical protein